MPCKTLAPPIKTTTRRLTKLRPRFWRYASVAGVACVAAGLWAGWGGVAYGQRAVEDAASLQRAIAAAGPAQVIRLKGGLYGALTVDEGAGAKGLTIVSANPADPAIFTSLALRGGKNVHFRDLQVIAPSHDPARPYLIQIEKASNVSLERVIVHGAGGLERGREYAVWLRDVGRASVVDCRFEGTRYGVGLLNGKGVSLRNNVFRGLQTDGIRGGGVSDLLIKGNVLASFSPKPREHPDGIQLWTNNQKAAARRITISDNLIARGGGRPIQGIFVRDTRSQLPFEDVLIEGNLVVGTLYNGIAVLGARGLTLRNNHIIAQGGQRSWIRMDNVAGLKIEGNRAPEFLIDRKAAQPGGNERTGRNVEEVQSQAIRKWLEARPWLKTVSSDVIMGLTDK